MNKDCRHIQSYVHQGRIGVLVELEAKTPFALETSEFVDLAKDLAIHVAADGPKSVGEMLQQSYAKDP